MLIKACHAWIFVIRENAPILIEGEEDLCEAEVLASGGNGGEDLLAEDLVALVFRKIKF
jgi:hypothetical protein